MSVNGQSAKITDIEKLLDTPVQTEPKEPIRQIRLQKKTNIPLLIMMFVIVVFGLIVLYSVSGPDGYAEFNDSAHYLKSQAGWTVLGIAVVFFFQLFDVKWLAKKPFVIAAFLAAVGLALATIVFGYNFNGARRWIQIGSLHFQASEGVKVSIIVAYAGYRQLLLEAREKGITKKMKTPRSQGFYDAFLDFILPVSLALVVDVLIVVEPHFSCFIIIGLVILIQTFFAGINIRSWIYGIIFFLILGAIGLSIVFIVPSTREKATGYIQSNFAHVFKRFDMFSAGDEEDEEDSKITKDDTRQIDNAHDALGSGGVWGVGIGESRSKYSYVAEAQNDYIFSIYVEETGFVGGTLLILLYLVVFVMCMYVVWRADGVFTRMVAGGSTALIFVEFVLNLSVELQVIPSTGITFPFMSFGGTAQFFLLVAFGLILSVSKFGSAVPVQPQKIKKEK